MAERSGLEGVKQRTHAAAVVARADALSAWLRNSGVADTTVAVDFVDVVDAAHHVDEILTRLLERDPTNPVDAAHGLDELGRLYAWLFTEMLPHLKALRRSWPMLEASLDVVAREGADEQAE
jgi:hypothetical protein